MGAAMADKLNEIANDGDTDILVDYLFKIIGPEADCDSMELSVCRFFKFLDAQGRDLIFMRALLQAGYWVGWLRAHSLLTDALEIEDKDWIFEQFELGSKDGLREAILEACAKLKERTVTST